MNEKNLIDISFNFLTDTPAGKDPDTFSPTLRSYHKHLWSKALPNGSLFKLDDTKKNVYLYHSSDLGEFFLSSDSAIHTFTRMPSMAHIIGQLKSGEADAFRNLSYTIGGMIIFPANRIDGKATINGARGMHPRIKDRIDLTLECIRRHYNNQTSPLSEALARYKEFFALFTNFRGYVEYFLLQDLVAEDFSTIKFFMPFDDFKTPALPQSLEAYLSYKELTIEFVTRRNLRILLSADQTVQSFDSARNPLQVKCPSWC
jgi:hypothetical protein